MDSVHGWKPPVVAPCSRAVAPRAASGSPRVSPESKSGPFSLAFANRLHHRREFLQFFSGSEVYRLALSSVFRRPNQVGHFRLGVTFKVRLSSVERNAIRRRVRESMRRLAPVLGSHDYNVVIQRVQRPARIHARRIAEELSTGIEPRRPVPVKPKPAPALRG
jgi:ribonuclease P protein component